MKHSADRDIDTDFGFPVSHPGNIRAIGRLKQGVVNTFRRIDTPAAVLRSWDRVSELFLPNPPLHIPAIGLVPWAVAKRHIKTYRFGPRSPICAS